MFPPDPTHWGPDWMCLLLSGRSLWQARADPEQQRVRLCQLWHGVVLKHYLMVGWQYMQTCLARSLPMLWLQNASQVEVWRLLVKPSPLETEWVPHRQIGDALSIPKSVLVQGVAQKPNRRVVRWAGPVGLKMQGPTNTVVIFSEVKMKTTGPALLVNALPHRLILSISATKRAVALSPWMWWCKGRVWTVRGWGKPLLAGTLGDLLPGNCPMAWMDPWRTSCWTGPAGRQETIGASQCWRIFFFSIVSFISEAAT